MVIGQFCDETNFTFRQTFNIYKGVGSNGKSMLMNLASKALGDYAAVVPISLFTQKRAGSGSAAPEVIRLKGRRFVTMQEPDEKVALNTGLMKQISSKPIFCKHKFRYDDNTQRYHMELHYAKNKVLALFYYFHQLNHQKHH